MVDLPIFLQGEFVFGDGDVVLADHAVAGDQDFTATSGRPPTSIGVITAIGDTRALAGSAMGGADTVTALGSYGAEALGDSYLLTGAAHGGNDHVVAHASVEAYAFGDAETISGHAIGGDDLVEAVGYYTGGNVYGDARLIEGDGRGGNDTLSGGGKFGAVLFGDADTMTANAHGGNDLLIASPNLIMVMYGDARVLDGSAAGGNDTLVGSRGRDIMYGDAAVVGPHASTGADLFVFAAPNGQDMIGDFQPGKDRIELDGFGFTSFQDLASHFHNTDGGVLISFDASNRIFLAHVTASQLSAGDFVFG